MYYLFVDISADAKCIGEIDYAMAVRVRNYSEKAQSAKNVAFAGNL
jgi:hypothetical protein